MVKKILQKCKPENVFWLCDGKTLKSINELINELKKIEDSVFQYHVNNEKNDFANWLRDIFKESELAKKLANVKDKKQYLEIIELKFKNPKKKKKKTK